jgi:site-specific DNA-methyltransferase (adenine-specific)
VQQQPITKNNVFSNKRNVEQPEFTSIDGLSINRRQKMDGLSLMRKIDANSIPLVFFDPQYRSILDKQNYGNEGESRGKRQLELPQMTEDVIVSFIKEIERILIPTGHLMLWVDKYILCSGFSNFVVGTQFEAVDLITWNKNRMGMGYRTRRFSEYLIIFQKPPKMAKGVWQIHDIPDVWTEKVDNGNYNHIHAKPVELQKRLIEAVTNNGDIVVDPAAGGYSVMKSALKAGRQFLGCDILE